MSLAKQYCREILRELDHLPVFLPGRNVQVGDVIKFGRINLFSRPLGEFDLITTLDQLKVDVQTRKDPEPDPFLYASKSGVSISFKLGAGNGAGANGSLSVGFTKEGTVYLAALGCVREEMTNVHTLATQLTPHRDQVDWNNCYIVTSVTTAARAVMMQSNSNRGQLMISGDAQGLNPMGGGPINANAKFSVSSYKDASFIKDLSREAPVFLSLVRYKKNWIGDWGVGPRAFAAHGNGAAAISADVPYVIVSVDRDEILADEPEPVNV
ncbi:MAG: hypothetical protein R3330_17545 [Saprospiraceae bacterium]|nr:hypothetical protein [Saprospiraceae bacterium]